MFPSKRLCFALTLGALSVATGASASIIDPANDFLPTFTGTRGLDLDVRTAAAGFDGAEFILDATLGANVGTTPSGFYVWGVDRGQGTPRFGVISGTGTGRTYDATGVLFDAVVVLRPGGSSVVNDLIAATSTPLPGADVSVHGAELRAIVPVTFLPSRGFSFADYGFNLWPRDALTTGNGQISDFAPDNSTIRAAAVTVPEPSSLALIAAAGFVSWRSRKWWRAEHCD